MSDAGVLRATAVVDDVFVDRRKKAGAVGGADWAAYLMARLGVRPIPPMPYVAVSVDSTAILMNSRIGDLPAQTRAELGPMVGFLDPATPISATIVLSVVGPEAVRFHLESVSINGFPVPEPFLEPYLSGVGRRYPMLTATGRHPWRPARPARTDRSARNRLSVLSPPAHWLTRALRLV